MNDQLTPYAELAGVIANLPLLLHEARRARGLSMRAAAAQLGMSPSTVLRIEAGEDCASSNVVAVLRWLDLPITIERPRCGDEWQSPHPTGSRPNMCTTCSETSGKLADLCTCTKAGRDPACPVHQGRRARGPKPPPLGPGCICDGSGRACPRHGVVL